MAISEVITFPTWRDGQAMQAALDEVHNWHRKDQALRGHKNARADLTREFVRSLFHYDSETGVIKYRDDLPYIPGPGRKCVPGKVLDRRDRKGAICISVGRAVYFGHRLAWIYMTGEWPTHEVDHINRDAGDNRWCNLREATSAQNLRNRRATRPNKSGYRGVIYSRPLNKWKAAVHLGHFDTPEAAHAAYNAAYRSIHGVDPVDI